jgi:alkylation response protein AidB-like acyl-CoA dehydrogenase
MAGGRQIAGGVAVLELTGAVGGFMVGQNRGRKAMDLTLSEPYQALQAEVRDFIRQHGDKSPKVGGGRKRPDQKTLDWQKRLVEHGYAGRTIPREYGGFGARPDVMAAAVIAGEFARANVYAGLTNQGISMLVPTLLEVGTEEQKRQYVGPTIRGDIIWCQGYSEPGRPSRRQLDRQRTENLDQLGPLRRHDVPAVPHRARQAEA